MRHFTQQEIIKGLRDALEYYANTHRDKLEDINKDDCSGFFNYDGQLARDALNYYNESTVTTMEEPPRKKVYDNVWFVLIMLFFVLGPIAFPMLWISKSFNKFWKVVLTILVFGLTVYTVMQCYEIIQMFSQLGSI